MRDRLSPFLLLILLLASFPVAEAKTHRAFDSHLLGGDCQLRTDPFDRVSRVWPVFCFRAKASSEVLLRQTQADGNLGISYGRIYSGIHVNNYFSFHASGIRRRLGSFDSSSEATLIKDDTVTESLFFQLGNKTLTKFSLSMGKMDMPFGVNHKPLMEIYNSAMKNNTYWHFPEYVANLTFDNQVDSRLEIAVSSNNFAFGADQDRRNKRSRAGSTARMKKATREAFTIRSNYDLSALEGTRVSISLYEERHRPRRFGLALLNRGANNSRSAFEWIRVGTVFRPDKDYQQLFRLTHATGFRASGRTVFEFELDHKNYRSLTLGMDRRIVGPSVMFRGALTYFWNDLPDEKNYFFVTLGVEAGL